MRPPSSHHVVFSLVEHTFREAGGAAVGSLLALQAWLHLDAVCQLKFSCKMLMLYVKELGRQGDGLSHSLHMGVGRERLYSGGDSPLRAHASHYCAAALHVADFRASRHGPSAIGTLCEGAGPRGQARGAGGLGRGRTSHDCGPTP